MYVELIYVAGNSMIMDTASFLNYNHLNLICICILLLFHLVLRLIFKNLLSAPRVLFDILNSVIMLECCF